MGTESMSPTDVSNSKYPLRQAGQRWSVPFVRGSVTVAPAVNRRSSRLTTAATEKGAPVVRRQYEQWQ